jgi:hypothetical protein
MPSVEVLIAIGAFLCVGGAILGWSIIDTRRTINRIADTLRTLGFEVRERPPRSERRAAHARFKGFKKHYHAASSLRVLATHADDDHTLEAAIAIRSAKNGHRIDAMIAARGSAQPVPRIEIAPKGLLGKAGLSGVPPVRGELLDKRAVSCDDPIALEQIATDAFQHAILEGLDEDHWIIEQRDGRAWVGLHRPSAGGSIQAIGAMIHDVERVLNALAD